MCLSLPLSINEESTNTFFCFYLSISFHPEKKLENQLYMPVSSPHFIFIFIRRRPLPFLLLTPLGETCKFFLTLNIPPLIPINFSKLWRLAIKLIFLSLLPVDYLDIDSQTIRYLHKD